ncbi:MAG: hypothetical protein EAZ57_11890, partial [Cytophagales bacterium]
QEEQKFQYNAKEKLDEFQLFWNDHGARNLDLQTARWTAIDPLAEFFWEVSPYCAFLNNPIYYADPTGMAAEKGVPPSPGSKPAEKDPNAPPAEADGGLSEEELEELVRKSTAAGAHMDVTVTQGGSSSVNYGLILMFLERMERSSFSQQLITEWGPDAAHFMMSWGTVIPFDLLRRHSQGKYGQEGVRALGNISQEEWTYAAGGVALGLGVLKIAKSVMAAWFRKAAEKSMPAGIADEVAEVVVEGATKGGANLTKSQLKSISSLEGQIAKHQSKLAEYIKDPMKFDNMGFLKNAPNDAVRQKIIQSRINHLNQEINTFQNNIQKILNGQ